MMGCGRVDDVWIRSATEDDLPALQELHQKLCEHEKQFVPSVRVDWAFTHEGVSYLRARMDSADGYLSMSILNGRPVGFLIGTLDGADRSCARLESVFVDDSARRKGLGRALFEDFVEWSESLGASRVTVAVAAPNRDTWAVYLKLGFVEIERKGISVILELRQSTC